jgi:HSP20 family molecular chaperone IbpA
MVRRFHRSIYDELDELRASMDYLYQLTLEPADNPLLPDGETPEIVCRSVYSLNADVAAHDDEVTVTLDTLPGAITAKISMDLLNEKTLSVTWNRDSERTGNTAADGPRERQSISLHRVIQLPFRVVPGGARVSLKHSVLDIHLKKALPHEGTP